MISNKWRLPLDAESKKNLDFVCWEKGSGFLAKRKGGHFHTGCDMIIPTKSSGQVIYAASLGKVVSIYAKEPNKAIMVQHTLPTGETVYSVYVHVTDIKVKMGEIVTTESVIGNLMNKAQLDKYGWEFNHLHFEILKNPRIGKNGKLLSYSTRCETKQKVVKHFYNPRTFLLERWALETP